MKYKICATTAGKYLLNEIDNPLLKPLISNLMTERFSDSEMAVKFNESVRGNHIFLFAECSKSENIVELMFAINAAYLAAASKVTIILPYFGYCRQDRQESQRGSLGAALIAKMITSRELASIVDRIVTIDLHAEQEQGFFNTPCEHIRGHAIFIEEVKKILTPNTKFVSPDAGGVKRVEKYASRLDRPMAGINKRRNKPNEIASMELVGEVDGDDVIIIDDIVDTFGTGKKAVQLLKEKGAKTVAMIATHGVLSGKAIQNLIESGLDTLIISDTIPLTFDWKMYPGCPEIKIISSIPIIQKVILNLIGNNSISELNN
ncbi:MAG: ribose-phosphate diphosphokinase [Bacteroidia bacterium]